ncbi:lipid droplet-associated protein [Gordonia sp. CPCC 206044]|uniref:lipid droplet-associated protein n=1 Tax=Gordonia sp. CPCC 206044 TaxID=3140793 RepID=UPI003AF3402B
MVRAPYPARIAAGLVVTALEETRKLPALAVTLPMTAVSQTLQTGMRLQQSIAELAIKGDLALESLFDKPSEQPQWARFDDDDDSGGDDTIDPESDDTPIESAPAAQKPTAAKKAKAPDEPPAKTPAPKKAVTKNAPVENAAVKNTADKKTADKKTAVKGTAAEKAGTRETANSGAHGDADDSDQPTTEGSSGRFALYSAPPDEVVSGDGPPEPKAPSVDGPIPEIVEYIEYDGLTLAQLRAKLRSVGLDELEQLSAYEKATRARAPFLTMIDNRIASQNSKRQPTT